MPSRQAESFNRSLVLGALAGLDQPDENVAPPSRVKPLEPLTVTFVFTRQKNGTYSFEPLE